MLKKALTYLIALTLMSCQLENDLLGSNADSSQSSSNTAPTAYFTATVNGLSITLDASRSSDREGDSLSYYWNVNGETSKTGKIISHTFSSGGIKTISLLVSDGTENATEAKRIEITAPIINTTPDANFTISSNGLTVEVDGRSSSDADDDSLSYAWSFNGEARQTFVNGEYSFSSAGTKSITLIVFDGKTYSIPTVKSIELTAPITNVAPIAKFTLSNEGLTVKVDASTSTDANGDTLSYHWDFNGEATNNFKSGEHTFNTEGVKNISLVVNDGQTDSILVKQSIDLVLPIQNTAPVAMFTVEVNDLTVTVDGSLSNDDEDDTLTYAWQFANEATDNKKNAQYTFTSAGEKTISLTVNDGSIDSVTVFKTVVVTEPALDYLASLEAITPFVNESCLFCHSTTPFNSAEISYGEALSADEVKNGIITYLTKYPDNVELVQNKPTLQAVNHSGGKPFAADPKRTDWINAVAGIALELNSEPSLGEGEIIFTEDYEDQTLDENPVGWGVNFEYNVNSNPGATQYPQIKVTDQLAHSGTKALYVDGRGLISSMRYSSKALTLPDNKERVFVRYYLLSTEYIGNRALNPDGSQPNHNHFMALENGQSKEIRIGEVKGALGVNEFGRDDIVPTAEYWYGQIETPRINANTWYCVETAFLNDGDKPELKTWLNEELVTHIEDQTDFKNGSAIERWLDDRFGRISLGWANYGTYDTEVYFDDIVVSTERIGCN